MPAPKGTRDKAFSINATDSVHVYSKAGEIWLQLRRNLRTLDHLGEPSFKTTLSLTPAQATAIAQELLSRVTVQPAGRKAVPTPSVSLGGAKLAAKNKSKAATPASPPSQNGKLWTKEEEKRLVTGYDAGKTILQIAKDHQRGPGVVHSRLKKLGKVQPGQRVDYSFR